MKRNLRNEIKSLRAEEERDFELRQKLYTIKDEVLNREEREKMRWLLDNRILDIKGMIHNYKFNLLQSEEIKKLTVGEIYEHHAFADTIEIKSIYVEDGKVMVDTIYSINNKKITQEYQELLSRLAKDYVLIKEVK